MKLRISPQDGAFTLTEVLVSSALVVAIMGLMLTTVDQTRRTINSTTARVTQFQSARIGFEAMTRNLSQATLNTYWDTDRDVNKNPVRYRRQSDLHFLSGRASAPAAPGQSVKFFNEGENIYPGHAVFFQAPLGFTSAEVGAGDNTARQFSALSNLLTAVGYYVKWEKEKNLPDFLDGGQQIVAERFRYRLMEVLQPGETNMIFNSVNYTTVNNMPVSPASPYGSPVDWVQVALGRLNLPAQILSRIPGTPPGNGRIDFSRPLAENIVAMIILPKVAEQDRASATAWDDLTADFGYDSRPRQAFENQVREVPTTSSDVITRLRAADSSGRLVRQLHQLPPIIQVTMVAIDEESAVKLQDWVVNKNGGVPPNWTTGMFDQVTDPVAFLKELGDPVKLDTTSLVYKISNPDRTLPHPRLNYRVFTTDVVMRGAKWSKDN